MASARRQFRLARRWVTQSVDSIWLLSTTNTVLFLALIMKNVSCQSSFFCHHAVLGVFAELRAFPENVVAQNGMIARLKCSTTKASVQWTRQGVGHTGPPTDVYIGSKIVRRLEARFSIKSDEEGQFDLFISNTEPTDAGTYSCVDDGGIGDERRAAELTVVGQSLLL